LFVPDPLDLWFSKNLTTEEDEQEDEDEHPIATLVHTRVSARQYY
jgi:hypothetical protein